MMYHDDVYLSEVKGEWHMKKMVSLLAAFVLMVAMFTACGQSSPAAPAQTGSEAETEASGKAGTFDPSQIKTMADVFEWAPEEVIQESYNLEDMEAGLYHGPFSFNVKFAYDGEQMENTDDFDFYEEFKDLKVSSVTYEGLGDASGL